jgi:FtsZ-binding cell division protein ZapB
MTDLLKPRAKEPEQEQIEKIRSEIDALKQKRQKFIDEQGRIKANLGALGPGKTEDKLREKYKYEQREWEEKTKAISKLIESKESDVTKLKATLRHGG